jgi:hypothetical protein
MQERFQSYRCPFSTNLGIVVTRGDRDENGTKFLSLSVSFENFQCTGRINLNEVLEIEQEGCRY